MKSFFCTKTFIALAVAATVVTAAVNRTQAQPMPPAADSALPASIVPGSPLAEVVKMVQAGVDVGTIQSYVVNSPSPFNLDADKIIFLKDVGVPNELVNAMMERDKILYASTVNPPAQPATVVTGDTDTAPPPAEVTVDYFYDTLSPYGSWMQIDGYGRCWRPTVAIYDQGWRPYCDRGHWVNSDYGWYWDSSYSWGIAFHYGRWFHHARFGWLWYPDTVWAPSWVTWRSGGEYCGWAPLPPFAVFTPGVGFFYRGVSVSLNFDFGLGADCFMFLSPEHFCDRQPRAFCFDQPRVKQIFYQTTVINNFNVHSTTLVNRGISVDHISSAIHRPLEPVHISSLPNAGKQGWRGEGFQRSFQHSSADTKAGQNFSGGNNQLRHGPELHPDLNAANATHRETFNQNSQENLKGQANNNNGNIYQSQHRTETVTTANNHFQQSPPPAPNVIEHRQPPIISHEQEALQSRQVRSYDASQSSGQQQHGAMQLQPHQSVSQSQPREEVHPPPAPPQNEPHNSNGGSGGGANNGKNPPNH